MFTLENFRTGEEFAFRNLSTARRVQEAWWDEDPTLSGWTGIWHNGELV